ncbi:phosphate ABC transporter permease PstA [Candidatus Saccharibacteria bacterium]|jgi:phosphate transport system permease protein|nr:phosphate ABC transporter permease PstA [Candidatus Saccharibacteria bacterium]
MSVFIATSRRRLVTNVLIKSLLLAGVIAALLPLVLVIGYVFAKGLPAFSADFFLTDPTGAFFGDQGGIRSAIIGTFAIVGLASLIAIPTGIALAVYLNEIGKKSKLASGIRYGVDILTGVPSIVFGLFIYSVLVIGDFMTGFAAWKGSLALALLMLPVVIRAGEVSLAMVPTTLREAALALGAPRWRVILFVVLPSAVSGLVTGSLLAIARTAGETAPLLFTVLGAQALTMSFVEPMNSLPLQIFNDIRQPNPDLVTRAWGAALTLILLILVTTLIARFAARRNRI